MSKYIAYQITEDRNILVVDERQFTISISIPNYIIDLYLPILGYDGIGVITMLYRFIDKQQRGPRKYKPHFNIKQYAHAGRVGYRTLDTILDKLVACRIIRVQKPEGVARRWHHHTEIILLDPPRDVPREFREEVIKRSPAQWLFAQESSTSASYEPENDDDEVPGNTSMEAPVGTSIKAPVGTLIKAPVGTLIEVPDSNSIKASVGTSMRDDSTWDGIQRDAPPPPDVHAGEDGVALRAWLIDAGMGVAAATRHQGNDHAAAILEFQARVGDVTGQEREQRIGRLVKRWDARPPTPPAPPLAADRDPTEDRQETYRVAHWHARDLLGPGAGLHDMATIVEALVGGATDEQALSQLGRERTV